MCTCSEPCCRVCKALSCPALPAAERLDECYCFVALEQALQPWGIPGFLYGAFKNFARGQVGPRG